MSVVPTDQPEFVAPDTGMLERMISYRTRRSMAPYLYLMPTLLLLLLLMLFPMGVVLHYATLDNVIMNRNPTFVGLDNFWTILRDETFRISIVNTLYFTVMSVVFHLGLGLGFALMLNSERIHPAVRAMFRVLYILPWLFTAVIIAIVWRLLLDPSGVVNAVLTGIGIIERNVEWFSSSDTAIHALTFVNIWAGYPLFMVSLLAGLQGVPGSLYEAASIDGANEFQKLRYITVPHLMPVIVSIALLDFIWTMQVFPLVWLTTGGGPIHATEMIGTYTYKLAFTRYEFSLASASAVVMLMISLVGAFFYLRYQKVRD